MSSLITPAITAPMKESKLIGSLVVCQVSDLLTLWRAHFCTKQPLLTEIISPC